MKTEHYPPVDEAAILAADERQWDEWFPNAPITDADMLAAMDEKPLPRPGERPGERPGGHTTPASPVRSRKPAPASTR